MTEAEKEKYKSILQDINKEMPKGTDFYDEHWGIVAHKNPAKEALAIADIAGILYKVLDVLESDSE